MLDCLSISNVYPEEKSQFLHVMHLKTHFSGGNSYSEIHGIGIHRLIIALFSIANDFVTSYVRLHNQITNQSNVQNNASRVSLGWYSIANESLYGLVGKKGCW